MTASRSRPAAREGREWRQDERRNVGRRRRLGSHRTWASWPTPAPRSWRTSCGCPQSQSWCCAPAGPGSGEGEGAGRGAGRRGRGERTGGVRLRFPCLLPRRALRRTGPPACHVARRMLHSVAACASTQKALPSPRTHHVIGIGLVQLGQVCGVLLHATARGRGRTVSASLGCNWLLQAAAAGR